MCYNCNTPSHVAYFYSPPDSHTQGRTGVNILQMGVILTHHINMYTIPLTCIMIGSCSNDSVTNHLEVIENFLTCTEDDKSRILTNGWSKDYDSNGSINNLPMDFHFNTYPMDIIILLKDVASLPYVKVTMDTSKNSAATFSLVDDVILKLE